MNIPLDNLYHWVESLIPDPVVLYVFNPHGSKKISDCRFIKCHDRETVYKLPGAIAHDQEPLDWDFYNHPEQYLELELWKKMRWHPGDIWEKLKCTPFDDLRYAYFANFNLKSLILERTGEMYDQSILIHSEKNSMDLEKYQQHGFICVHYWAHAVIARD